MLQCEKLFLPIIIGLDLHTVQQSSCFPTCSFGRQNHQTSFPSLFVTMYLLTSSAVESYGTFLLLAPYLALNLVSHGIFFFVALIISFLSIHKLDVLGSVTNLYFARILFIVYPSLDFW